MPIIKKIIFIVLLVVTIALIGYVFIMHHQMLETYADDKKSLNNQIEAATVKQQELKDELNSINSVNTIESIARDKLDMYFPNERVYIDISK
jgi:cell division protein FtsL